MQPNTPEGRRAASKVFNGFMALAAANLVLVAIVMGPRSEQPKPAPVKVTEALGVEMKRVFDAAMVAWGRGDAAGFYAQFSAKHVPADSAEVFKRVFAGVYAEEFGQIKAMKLDERESSTDPDYGMLVFEAECSKHPKAKVSANFLRENGQLKLAQIRLEKL